MTLCCCNLNFLKNSFSKLNLAFHPTSNMIQQNIKNINEQLMQDFYKLLHIFKKNPLKKYTKKFNVMSQKSDTYANQSYRYQCSLI